MKKRKKGSVSSSSFPSSTLRSLPSFSFTPAVSTYRKPRATRGVFSWKDSRARLLFRLGNVACALPLSPFRRPPTPTDWLVNHCWSSCGREQVGIRRETRRELGSIFFSPLFSPFFFLFPRGETVARDRERKGGEVDGKRGKRERLITVMHWMDAPVASKQAFFYRMLQEINLPRLPVEFSSFYGSSLLLLRRFFFFSLSLFLTPSLLYLSHSLFLSLSLSVWIVFLSLVQRDKREIKTNVSDEIAKPLRSLVFNVLLIASGFFWLLSARWM